MGGMKVSGMKVSGVRILRRVGGWLRGVAGWMLRVFVGLLDDLLVLAGCGLVLVFVYQVWPVGTWLVGGLMLVGAGLMVGRLKSKRGKSA